MATGSFKTTLWMGQLRLQEALSQVHWQNSDEPKAEPSSTIPCPAPIAFCHRSTSSTNSLAAQSGILSFIPRTSLREKPPLTGSACEMLASTLRSEEGPPRMPGNQHSPAEELTGLSLETVTDGQFPPPRPGPSV